MQRFFFALVVIGICDSASAQSCLGTPSLSSAHLQLGTAASLLNAGPDFGVNSAVGSDALFARAGVGVRDQTNQPSYYRISAGVGSDRAVERLHICPLAAFEYLHGPSSTHGSFALRDVTGSVGASVGLVALDTARVAVVPTIGAAFNYTRRSAHYSGPLEVGSPATGFVQEQSPAFDCSPCQTYATTEVGVGVIFSGHTAIRLGATVYSGFPGDNRSVGLGVAHSFSRRSSN